MHLAAAADDAAAIQRLFNSGSDIEAVNLEHQTPLLVAAFAGAKRSCVQLLRCGASALCTDSDGLTASHIAAARNDCVVLEGTT